LVGVGLGEPSGLDCLPGINALEGSDETSSTTNLTDGFCGDASVVDKSTILRLGVFLLRADEVLLISLVVEDGICRSLSDMIGSIILGCSTIGLMTPELEGRCSGTGRLITGTLGFSATRSTNWRRSV